MPSGGVSRTTSKANCTRLSKASFPKIEWTWSLTVCKAIAYRFAISLFERPAATPRAISRSLAVSVASDVDGACGEGPMPPSLGRGWTPGPRRDGSCSSGWPFRHEPTAASCRRFPAISESPRPLDHAIPGRPAARPRTAFEDRSAAARTRGEGTGPSAEDQANQSRMPRRVPGRSRPTRGGNSSGAMTPHGLSFSGATCAVPNGEAALLPAAGTRGPKLVRLEHRLNVSGEGSDLRTQIRLDARYPPFLGRGVHSQPPAPIGERGGQAGRRGGRDPAVVGAVASARSARSGSPPRVSATLCLRGASPSASSSPSVPSLPDR
jgi:hypothetical protein